MVFVTNLMEGCSDNGSVFMDSFFLGSFRIFHDNIDPVSILSLTPPFFPMVPMFHKNTTLTRFCISRNNPPRSFPHHTNI